MVFACGCDLDLDCDLDLYRGSDQDSDSAYDRTYFLNSKPDLEISIKMCVDSIVIRTKDWYN